LGGINQCWTHHKRHRHSVSPTVSAPPWSPDLRPGPTTGSAHSTAHLPLFPQVTVPSVPQPEHPQPHLTSKIPPASTGHNQATKRSKLLQRARPGNQHGWREGPQLPPITWPNLNIDKRWESVGTRGMQGCRTTASGSNLSLAPSEQQRSF
jgi:hypothetical protein